MRKKIPPGEVQHEWLRKPGTKRGDDVYECPHCKSWTANAPLYLNDDAPLYLNDVCPARDRRKRKVDRREAR